MLVSSNDQAASLYGVLYEIAAKEIEALDRSEGRGKGYDRVDDFEVWIIPDDKLIRAVTYMADKTSVDTALKPYDWYLDLAVKGAEHHRLPVDYVGALSSRPCLPDPVLDRKTRVQAFGVLAELKQDGIVLRSRANIRIAGKRNVGNWVVTRAQLTNTNDPAAWKKAYADFFLERISSRYLEPVEVLRKAGDRTGEGFAITAIQCSLIEFLGATLKGQSYVHASELKGRKKTDLEYVSSGKMFVEFLRSAPPFRDVFLSDALAWDFYNGVRCGLLHEARTKKGWTIRTRSSVGPFLDAKAKVVYRDDLHRAFEAFTAWYGAELCKNMDYQEAFIRKFDSLCAD
jgi:hypothetical protein